MASVSKNNLLEAMWSMLMPSPKSTLLGDPFRDELYAIESPATANEILARQQEHEQMIRDQIALAKGAFSNGSGSLQVTPKVTNQLEIAENRKAMIAMRLRVPSLAEFPFPHFATIYANDIVYVTIVTDKGAVMFEDDAGMFPSDVLVSQLRLLK